MKVVFISNFYNHHQAPFSLEMSALTGGQYSFIATTPISEERLQMGWGRDEVPDFVRYSFSSPEETNACRALVDEADVVILGNASREWIKKRLEEKKLTFFCTERIYKKKGSFYKLPVHFLRNLKEIIPHKNLYLLCCSAYAAADYAKTLSFIGKAYKWGYFTALKRYDDVDEMIGLKQPASLLWVSRLIELKHPEIPVAVAKRLKEEGFRFTLRMIGNGELEDATHRMIEDMDVADCVEMLGAMSPDEVRRHMEQSEIFLFTSDRNEGWGAVLNESMNSACAVVANRAIGSVPFLVRDGETGYAYDDTKELYHKVKSLLDDSENRRRLGRNAYVTMMEKWNAGNAAQKLLALSEAILRGQHKPQPFEDGVCSKAEILWTR